MRKVIVSILVLILLLSCCSCGNNESEKSNNSASNNTTEELVSSPKAEKDIPEEIQEISGIYSNDYDTIYFGLDGSYKSLSTMAREWSESFEWPVPVIGIYNVENNVISISTELGASRYKYSYSNGILSLNSESNPDDNATLTRIGEAIENVKESFSGDITGVYRIEEYYDNQYTGGLLSEGIVFCEDNFYSFYYDYVQREYIVQNEGEYELKDGTLKLKSSNQEEDIFYYVELEYNNPRLYKVNPNNSLLATGTSHIKTDEDAKEYINKLKRIVGNELDSGITLEPIINESETPSNKITENDNASTLTSETATSTQSPSATETYYIATDNINIRSGAGKSYEKVYKVYAGDIIQVFNKVENVDGYTWYEIAFEGSGEWIAFDSSWLAPINDEQKAVVDKYSNYDGFNFICKCATDDKYNYWVISLVGGGDVYAIQDKLNVKSVVDFDWSNQDLNVGLLNSLYQAYDFKLVTFKSMRYEGAFTTDYKDIKDCNAESWTVTDSNGTTEYWYVYPYEMGYDLYRATKDSSGTYSLEFLISGE